MLKPAFKIRSIGVRETHEVKWKDEEFIKFEWYSRALTSLQKVTAFFSLIAAKICDIANYFLKEDQRKSHLDEDVIAASADGLAESESLEHSRELQKEEYKV